MFSQLLDIENQIDVINKEGFMKYCDMIDLLRGQSPTLPLGQIFISPSLTHSMSTMLPSSTSPTPQSTSSSTNPLMPLDGDSFHSLSLDLADLAEVDLDSERRIVDHFSKLYDDDEKSKSQDDEEEDNGEEEEGEEEEEEESEPRSSEVTEERSSASSLRASQIRSSEVDAVMAEVCSSFILVEFYVL